MGYTVTIEPLGVEVEVEEGQTILDASLRAGVYLPHACCHGLCATCKVTVLEGEVDHGPVSNFALMDYERDEGQCLACCATPESDLVIEADVDEEPDARFLPVRDYTAVVTRIADLTPTIKGVWLQVASTVAGDVPFDFQAGQYVNLQLPGLDEPRAFSIASTPQADLVELNIRLVPGGKGTTWVHESMAVGDRLTLTAPYGRFFVRTSRGGPTLFLAGGSGLSSPRSMVLDLLATGWSQPITLVQGARTLDELYYRDEFEALAAQHPQFTYVPALSDEPAGSDWAGARGFVHDVAREHFGNDFRGNTAYLCGPPVMIDACITTLMQGRLFERDIFTEKFLSAADAAQNARSPLFRKI